MKFNLSHIAGLCYRWGDLQAIQYDQAREDLFPQPFLLNLYNHCKISGRAKNGILEPLFCGMKDISQDAIVAYLSTLKLIVLGRWTLDPSLDSSLASSRPPFFEPLGFCFPTVISEGRTTRAGFAAYAFLQPAWGTPDQLVLTYLGISYLFYEFRLDHLHGIRYADNKLTARWMGRFGFRDLGTIPSYLVRTSTGELTDATISTLARGEFESQLSAALELGEQLESEPWAAKDK